MQASKILPSYITLFKLSVQIGFQLQIPHLWLEIKLTSCIYLLPCRRSILAQSFIITFCGMSICRRQKCRSALSCLITECLSSCEEMSISSDKIYKKIDMVTLPKYRVPLLCLIQNIQDSQGSNSLDQADTYSFWISTKIRPINYSFNLVWLSYYTSQA